jgi:hypothetical protein
VSEGEYRLPASIWIAVVPALAALGYRGFLAERHDYLGHFLAGYGGTLLLVWMAARIMEGRRWAVVFATLVALSLGWFAEHTVFALAGFDPIDFHSQSLGAVLGGLAVLETRTGDPDYDWDEGLLPFVGNARGLLILATACLSLVLGTVYALR